MSSETSLSDMTLAYAEELTDAIVGLDRVYRDESGDETGVVVLDLSGGRDATTFAGYDEADTTFADLRDRADGLPEADRSVYYRQFCESMLAVIEWRESGLALPDQVERFLHVPSEPPTTADLDALRADLSGVLAGLGYEGPVGDQCRAWKADTAVETGEVVDVLTERMAAMREETLSTLDLPDDAVPRMDGKGVPGAPFNAKCDFADRRVVVNTDPELTGPWLNKLAVHEGYPGHVLQFALRKHWYETGAAPADGLLSVVNCASSTTFEGIADCGLALLNARSAHDEAIAHVSRYQTAIATLGAWNYHRRGWSMDELHDWLAERAIYGDEGWVRNRVEFVTAPERATLMWSYWHGEPSVADILGNVDPEDRNTFVRSLYSRMHSPDSLATFSA